MWKKYSNYKKCQEIEIIWTTTFKHIGIKYDAYLLKIIKMYYDLNYLKSNQLWNSKKRDRKDT